MIYYGDKMLLKHIFDYYTDPVVYNCSDNSMFRERVEQMSSTSTGSCFRISAILMK